jgi:signal-transduction protein with cAMP-binding, CBS, and nucleotidyltransferase domain
MPLLDFPDRCIRDAMHAGVIAVEPEATVAEASAHMVRDHVHRVFVTKGQRLEGVFSTKDVMHAVAAAKVNRPVSDFMSSPVISVGVLETIATATDRLASAGVAGLVVVDEEEKPVGVFTQLEALQARHLSAATPVDDAMSYAMLCLDVGMPLHRAASYAAETRVRRVIAVEHRKMWGVLTGIDFARAAFA